MTFLIAFILAFIVNTILWTFYRMDLYDAEKQVEALGAANRNLHRYIDELQDRCEKYRQAMVTEMLAAKHTTPPASRVYPAQRKNDNFFIENNLN
jgi:cell division protein FtsB